MSPAPARAVPSHSGAETDADLSTRVDALLAKQRDFFASGATLPRSFREQQLRALRHGIRKHERRLHDALASDLHKSESEAYLTEIGFVLADIRHTVRNVGRWMRPHGTFPPLVTMPSRGQVHAQPLGVNLVIAPWNYPIQLALAPLVAALAAGNTAVIKPSELAPASSAALAELVGDTFDEELVALVEGDVEVAQTLLARRWDHIFFTGSTSVGRIVARAAADQLTRVTLELGGKSPAIVMPSADLDAAARRIVWGKFTNAGQTCVAPDYLLVHHSVHDTLIDRIVAAVRAFYGADPRAAEDYGRIVNRRHFERLVRLIDAKKVVHGGEHDAAERYIAPTILRDVSMSDAVMSEEIFGPILPVMAIDSIDEAIRRIGERPNPLALYLFTKDRDEEHAVIERVSFGGGCVNGTLVHLADLDMPFGGIGQSGTGAYHGRTGFETFSHRKSVLRCATFLDPDLKYPPYKGKLGIYRRLIG
jgi:aldehyde dehydrogenase (NAD+)